MSDYSVGVDLGTTYSAAAVLRDGRLEVVELGERIASVASVLWFRHDGRVVVGEAAVRRAEAEPGRMAREFKRRFGDPVPLMVAGQPVSADVLTTRLLRWVIDAVTRQEGGEPAAVGVAHPANWGPYKVDLLAGAIRAARVDHAALISEPHAAAESHASAAQVGIGDVVAVYDLGGGTFDAAVLRRGDSGFELVGRAEGIERLGGIDFDEAVFDHVRRVLGGPGLAGLDHHDPVVAGALLRLREECVWAKEALSSDTEAIIPVALPDLHTSVRLTRGEFEEMIQPSVAATVDTLRRAITSAGLAPAQLSKVLLVGGSSRIPLVSLMVGAEMGCPVALDTHPKHAVAMGAAHLARCGTPVAAPVQAGARLVADRPPPTSGLTSPTKGLQPTGERPAAGERGTNGAPEAAPDHPLSWEEWKARSATSAPGTGHRRRVPRRRLWLICAVVLGVVLLVGGGAALAVTVGLPAWHSGSPPSAAAFRSEALRRFAGPLLAAPGASCAAAAPQDRKGQREAVDCRWDNGVRGRFYLATDRSGLEQVRRLFLSSTGTVPGSFTRAPDGWSNAQQGTRQGESAQYVLASDNSANIYYDQDSTLCWGVLWLPTGDQQKLRDFWLRVT